MKTEAKEAKESSSFTDKKIRIHFAQLCFSDQKAIASCFDSIDLGFRYSLKSFFPPHLTELGPTRLLGGSVKLDFNNWLQAKRQSPDTHPGKPMAFGWLKDTRLEPIEIEIQKFEVLSKSNQVLAGFSLKSEGTNLNFAMTAKANRLEAVGQALPGEIANTTLHLLAEDPSGTVLGPWGAQGQALAEIHHVGKVQAELSLLPDAQAIYQYMVQAQFNGSSVSAHTDLRGSLEKTKLQATLSEDVRLLLQGKTQHLGADKCRLEYSQTDEGNSKGQIVARCPLFYEIPRQVF